jgi:hypothetical protein
VLRCRLGEGHSTLDISPWTFDVHLWRQMVLRREIAVYCEALHALKALLSDAQQPSWMPGGVDCGFRVKANGFRPCPETLS